MTKRGWLFLSALLALAALSVLAIWRLVGTSEDPVEIRLDRLHSASEEQFPTAFRLAIAPVLSSNRTVESYESLTTYLSQRLGRPVRIVQRKTYGEINELLRHGAVQAALVCTGAYLHAVADNISLEVIAVPVYADGPVYYSLIIVRSDSGITSLDDLKGRPLAFSDPLSLSGHYYLLSKLLDLNLDPRRYFSRTTFTYSHDGSIKAVLDGIAEAAAVDSLVYDYELRHSPTLSKSVRVIHRSPPLGASPVVAPTSLDPALRDRVRRAFLSMADSDRGKAVLTDLAVQRFVSPPPNLYDTASRVLQTVDAYMRGRQ